MTRYLIPLFGFLALAAGPPSIHADEAVPRSSPLPGGVADAAGKVGYVQHTDGTLDAVDLETGKVQWNVKQFARPLLLAGKRLLAQGKGTSANNVRILVVDTGDKGKILRTSDPVKFPDWVSVETTYGRSFQSSAEMDDKGHLLLRWEARAFYAGGAPPPPEVEQRARKHAAGLARIHPGTGKVAMLPATPPAELKLPKELAKIKPRQYWTGTTWESKPLLVGKKAAALSSEQAGGQEKMVLYTWDLASGKADAPRALLAGKALWPQLAGDGRHLFVHQALVKEQLPPGDYAWWVFNLETGKQVAKVPFEPGTKGLSLLGSRLYFLTEVTKGGPRGMQRIRTLKAVSAQTGMLVWQRQVWAPPVLLPLP